MSKNLYIIHYTKKDRLVHADESESKSKYKGGFVNGKNTSEYNHDYYIHNKDKWAYKLGQVKRSIQSFEGNLYRFLSGNKDTGQQPVLVSVGKGSHKYKYRITYKGKYRYFYSDHEYYTFLENVKKKQREYSIEDDCAAVNEGYPDEGRTRNCPYCTLAYDMRRRGYDVEANASSIGMNKAEIVKMWEGAKFESPKKTASTNTPQDNSKNLYSELASYGDGARGAFRVTWEKGGGHIMNWENIDGQTYIIDCQSNTVMPEWKFSRSVSSGINWDEVQYFRTDNLELSQYITDANLFKEHKG